MVKETEYRHHPVRVEEGLFLGLQQLDILGFRLHFLAEALDEDLTGLASTDWKPMDLAALMPTGETVPHDAVAVVLGVEVNESATGGWYMDFASVSHSGVPPGVVGVQPGKTETVYIAQLTPYKGSRIVIVELSEDSRILTKITSNGDLDYSINLIGWLIGGIRVARLTLPAVDLFCKFAI